MIVSVCHKKMQRKLVDKCWYGDFIFTSFQKMSHVHWYRLVLRIIGAFLFFPSSPERLYCTRIASVRCSEFSFRVLSLFFTQSLQVAAGCLKSDTIPGKKIYSFSFFVCGFRGRAQKNPARAQDKIRSTFELLGKTLKKFNVKAGAKTVKSRIR